MKQKKHRSINLWLALGVLILACMAGPVLLRRSGSLSTIRDAQSDGKLVVCIDPGHGGDDSGAVSGDRQEKDDNLRLALALRDSLRTLRPDIETVLTRDSDVYITLEGRCESSRRADADLFVSLHRNSAEDASGVELWCSSDRDGDDTALAEAILRGLRDVGISEDRGVKYGTAENPKGNYYVLGHASSPACLVELGFMGSEEDNRLLDERLTRYADAMAEAISGLLPQLKD